MKELIKKVEKIFDEMNGSFPNEQQEEEINNLYREYTGNDGPYCRDCGDFDMIYIEMQMLYNTIKK